MRIARVIGNVTLGKSLNGFPPGQLLIGEVLDGPALAGIKSSKPRQSPMPESLVVFDSLGAGIGAVIAISEGREAAAPFHPGKAPVDAYNAAILDQIEWNT
ncbi:EutN/CcmL family microcompartment protein [Mucisphaera calidilacus]|uniref:Ethanolamine utilization protein EutN/carboxysome n=1 Tax=Mucisphaera calidilacus TaxID=2527982 RepID=A0A518BYF7_9BACT|nr:EutN/CcmL family microcompartment protein [Mucisphaera calidilacus]QDU72009.1 Ethanolamine utilization protein EutN/carboxysome [Mucisphaera calidilacus]